MKTLLRIAPILLMAFLARADVVIEQKMESAVINGTVTVKIKGDQGRMDMANPVTGNVTTLMNFKSGDMVLLMHPQKMAMKMNLADIKKQQENAMKTLGIDPTKVEKPKATGQSEKVGEYNAEIYEMNQGGLQSKMWVAKDFPNAQAIKDQMTKLGSAMGVAGLDTGKVDVPGMVVKTEVNTPAGKMTMTIVKATEEAVEDSEFKQPEGYQEIKMPALPAPPVPAPPK